MTDCSKIPTLSLVEDSKKAMESLNQYWSSNEDTIVDPFGVARKTAKAIDDIFNEAEADAISAAQSANAAEAAASSAGYKGLWPDTGGSALKGETWQTQVGGTPTGEYYTALQNTSVDPVGDDVNWKIQSDLNTGNLSDYTDIVYKASGGNSAVENMIAGIPFTVPNSSKVSTGSTSWVVNSTQGIPLDSGLFAKPINGLWLNDWDIDETGVTACDDEIDQMLAMAELIGAKCKARGNNSVYLITRQQTVRHGVSLDFQGAEVNFVQSTANNDSPFQLGNNSELKNIYKGTYKSQSNSTFTTLGFIKLGEFYAFSGGVPNSGENSLDSSYFEIENPSVSNVNCECSEITTKDDRGFNAVVYLIVATGAKLSNLKNSGLCKDGQKHQTTRSVVRSEGGYDTQARRKGVNNEIKNIQGYDLRAYWEDGVVFINGDTNTIVDNVYGERCGMVFGARVGRVSADQDPSLVGKLGANISATNIFGKNLELDPSDTQTRPVCGIWAKSNEEFDDTNKSTIKIKNINLKCTDTVTNKLNYGIRLGGTNPAPGETDISARGIKIECYEVAGFISGIVDEVNNKSCSFREGYVHDSQSNGVITNGDDTEFSGIRVKRSNLGSQSSVSNGHLIRVGGKRVQLSRVDLGDEKLAAGSDQMKSAIFLNGDGANCSVLSGVIRNYNSSHAELGSNPGSVGVVGKAFDDLKSVERSIVNSGAWRMSPSTVKAFATFGPTGTISDSFRASVSKVSTGVYSIIFDEDFNNTNYRVNVQCVSGSFRGTFVTSRNVDGFTLNSVDSNGNPADSSIQFDVYGDYDTRVN